MLPCAALVTSPPCLCFFAHLPFPLVWQIAVLKEIEGKGPYCSLVMAVVVVKDVLLFAAFAVNIELAKVVSVTAAQAVAVLRASRAFCAVSSVHCRRCRWAQRRRPDR